MGAPRYQNVGVEAFSPGGGGSGSAVSEMVTSGTGCAQWQAVTNTGERANTGTVAHFGRVMGVTKVALAAGTKAILDCKSIAPNHFDTILEAETAGVAGNVLTFTLVGDSPPAGGVTITAVWPNMVVHYEAGVSTRAIVEGAIAGLATFIRVKTAGVYGALAGGDALLIHNLAGGADGAPGKVVTHGKIRNPAWAWSMTDSPPKPIYLNGNTLSQTDPVIAHLMGFNQQIGYPVEIGAVTSDTIDVDIGTPILA